MPDHEVSVGPSSSGVYHQMAAADGDTGTAATAPGRAAVPVPPRPGEGRGAPGCESVFVIKKKKRGQLFLNLFLADRQNNSNVRGRGFCPPPPRSRWADFDAP